MRNFAFTIFYCIILTTFWFESKAQYSGKIKLNETLWDFGQINENQKNISKTFWYINEGRGNIKIKNITSQCGCIISDWSKKEIIRGDSIFIKINLNPEGRPGVFNQIISVQTNGFPEIFTIQITGNVLKVLDPITKKYPFTIGNLLLSEQSIYWGESIINETKEKTILIFNNSKTTINIEDHIPSLPKYLKVTTSPHNLKPLEEGKIMLQLNTEKFKDRGFFMDLFHLYTNDSIERLKPIYQMGIVIDTHYNHINGSIPSLKINTTSLHLEQVISPEISEGELTITNTGTGDLIIYKSQSSCSCLNLKFSKTIIKPEEKTTVKVIFDSLNQEGKINKSIYIFTNDPKNPYKQIWIKAFVEKN